MDRNLNSLQKSVQNLRVALRKESVDRNIFVTSCCYGVGPSLSARRAWIEIPVSSALELPAGVALRKESVDRNIGIEKNPDYYKSRSPQGERG